MNPILLYPQNAAQAKFFSESAEKQGVEMISLPNEMLEDMEDWLLGAKMYELSKNFKPVPMEEVKKLVAQKLAE